MILNLSKLDHPHKLVLVIIVSKNLLLSGHKLLFQEEYLASDRKKADLEILKVLIEKLKILQVHNSILNFTNHQKILRDKRNKKENQLLIAQCQTVTISQH